MSDSFHLYPISFTTHEKENRTLITSSNTSPQLQLCLHQINALANGIKQSGFPANLPPPPPQSVNPHRSTELERIKKLGNDSFSKKLYGDAARHYSAALDLAASRPPWEPHTLAIDELCILLCNRSASFLAMDNAVQAYADAIVAVELKPGWVKGSYRLTRALLKLGKSRDAVDVVGRGLMWEPMNEDLVALERECLDIINDEKLC